MDAIRNAANAAASLVGYGDTNTEHNSGTTNATGGGEAPQNTYSSETQSGTEPVSGRLGAGTGGEPYDAGNEVGDVTGSSGYGSGSLLGGNTSGNTNDLSSTGYGSGSRSTMANTGSASGPTSGTESTLSGLANKFASGSGSGTTGSTSGIQGPPSGLTGQYADHKIFGGSGAESGNKGFGSTGNGGFGSTADTGAGSGMSSGFGSGEDSGPGRTAMLGSDVAKGKSGERYLYSAESAPGAGGHDIVDDFTHENINHLGSGDIDEGTFANVNAGKGEGQRGLARPSPGRIGSHGGSSSVSGLTSGTSNNKRNTGGASYDNTNTQRGSGESAMGTITRKIDEYTLGEGTTPTQSSGKRELGAIDEREDYSARAPLDTSAEEYPAAAAAYDEPSGTTSGAGGYPGTESGDIARPIRSGLESDRAEAIGQHGDGLNYVGFNSGLGNQSNKDAYGAGSTTGTGRGYESQSNQGITGGVGGTSEFSHTQGPGYDAVGDFGSHAHGGHTTGISDDLDDGCEAHAHGYQPHGGHPIGEAARADPNGKNTWLNYHSDPNVPLGEAEHERRL